MEIKWLKTFIRAAQYENFRKAAEVLFLAQPTVTMHIKRLEEELDMALFEKSGRNVVLTPAGDRFLPHAKDILLRYEAGLEDLAAWRQGYRRKITLSVSPLVASSFLPSVTKRFMQKFPDIEVIVSVTESVDIGDAVSRGGADVGLTRMIPAQEHLTWRKLYEDPVIFVAACTGMENGGVENVEEDKGGEDHGKRGNGGKDNGRRGNEGRDGGGTERENTGGTLFENLVRKNLILTHNHPVYWDELVSQIRRQYEHVRTMIVSQVHITKRFIEEGLGVSFLPKSTVTRELLEGRMQEVRVEGMDLPVAATYLVYNKLTWEIERFIEFLNEWGTEI